MGDLNRYNLVPFDYALKCWKLLSPDSRHDAAPKGYIPRRFEKKPDWEPERPAFEKREAKPGHCSVCGWLAGERGFVRLPFPTGHELFGRAICCPECWPWPFGHANAGKLSPRAHQIAALWDKEEMRERRREPEEEELPW